MYDDDAAYNILNIIYNFIIMLYYPFIVQSISQFHTSIIIYTHIIRFIYLYKFRLSGIAATKAIKGSLCKIRWQKLAPFIKTSFRK